MLTRSQLEALSAVSIRDELSADDICAALSTPPFLGGQVVTVAGEAEGGTRTTTSTSTSAATAVLNGRDLGCVPGSGLRPNLAFRCAMLRPTPETTAWLASNVKVVFDLRNHVEVQRSPDPTAEGVRNVPPVLAGTPKRIDLDKFAQGDGSEAWKETYLEILELYAPTFQAVLEHTRDSCEPFLFHCTAGRDRTGLLAGILHHIAGTSTDDVIYDYMLSRIGLEPLRGHIAIVAKQMGLSEEETQGDGFFHVSSLRPSYWTTFLGALEETYGGWDGYIRHLGFNDEDVQRIKANIT